MARRLLVLSMVALAACAKDEPSRRAHKAARGSASHEAPAPPRRAPAGVEDAIQRIAQGVALDKRVTVTLHIVARPGEPAKNHRVTVVAIVFGDDGAVKTFLCLDRGVKLELPAAGFRRVLVTSAPIDVEDKR